MLCVLEYKQEEKLQLVKGLTELFAEVDLNNDKHMEWSEFTQFIIDSVMQKKSGPIGLKKESRHTKSKSEQPNKRKVLRMLSSEVVMPNGGGFFSSEEESNEGSEEESQSESE